MFNNETLTLSTTLVASYLTNSFTNYKQRFDTVSATVDSLESFALT
jgi:hypothetical protein